MIQFCVPNGCALQPRFSIRIRSESEQDVEDARENAEILRRRSLLYVDAQIFAFSRADLAYCSLAVEF